MMTRRSDGHGWAVPPARGGHAEGGEDRCDRRNHTKPLRLPARVLSTRLRSVAWKANTVIAAMKSQRAASRLIVHPGRTSSGGVATGVGSLSGPALATVEVTSAVRSRAPGAQCDHRRHRDHRRGQRPSASRALLARPELSADAATPGCGRTTTGSSRGAATTATPSSFENRRGSASTQRNKASSCPGAALEVATNSERRPSKKACSDPYPNCGSRVNVVGFRPAEHR